MTYEDAVKIKRGDMLSREPTLAEVLQVGLGGYIDDDGDIVCITCHQLNECCKCDADKIQED